MPRDAELSYDLHKMSTRLISAALFAATLTPALAAATFDRLYVFGDSYSDTGAGYVDGNGPTAVAYLAEHLKLHLLPSTSTGSVDASLNFAVSGATTGSGPGRKVKDALLGLGMRNQVEDFTGRVHSHTIAFRPATTLFFLLGGLNDKRLPGETTVSNLEGEIRMLYGAGARHFLLALLPTEIPSFSEVGRRLNPEISRIPAAMRPELPGASLDLSHWGEYFDDVVRKPGQYGITNTTEKCAGRAIFDEDTTPCAMPDAYFYYHAGHPSTAVHKAVGEKLYQEVRSLRGPA
jgi:hypothetical protein